jgi:lipid-A-disaccharide synthase
MPEGQEAAAGPAPRATWIDHLRVAGVFGLTLLGGIPFLLYLPLSPILAPWLRAVTRRKLGRGSVAPVDVSDALPSLPAGATVFLVAGETSGDELAARAVRRLKEAAPAVRVRGYAGKACEAAGAELDCDITENAVYGFFAVVWSLGTWWRLCAETLARWRAEPPDLVLTVDFPGLNVRLARWARKRGIRTVHLVAPQLWAHTPWRIFRWRRAVDLLLATFPFAPPLFEDAGLPTVYVGHPLFQAPLPPARGAVDPAPGDPLLIELWPGSRRRELQQHVAVLIEAAADVQVALPQARFVARLAKPEHAALFEAGRADARRMPSALTTTIGVPEEGEPVYGAMAASGTATAQLAADLVPLTVFYRLGFVEWCFSGFLITSPWISLANLVLGRPLLPERLCWSRGVGAKIAADFLSVAGTPAARAEQQVGLREVRAHLETPHVAERIARVVLAELAGATRPSA